MNFCTEIDLYISLYIDDLLDEIQKEEFLHHISECSECAQKLKEASLFVELCRESGEIQLPMDFSASLHKKLLNTEAQQKQSIAKNKAKLLVFNKKWIAGLSTAAILVISLLAYNLLPNMGYKGQQTGAQDVSQSQSSPESSNQAAGGTFSSENKSMENAEAFSDKAQDSTSAANNDAVSASPKIAAADSDASSIKQPETSAASNNEKAELRRKESTSDSSRSSQPAAKKTENETVQPSFKADVTDSDQIFGIMATEKKYYSNSAELNLKVATQRVEIDALKQLMSDLGAKEITAEVNGIASATQEFKDYTLPLYQYHELLHRAVYDYHLELTVKTDLAKMDITPEYKDLVEMRSQITAKIEEAKAKGEDTSILEIKQQELTEKINNILVKNDMISVRIFIYR